MKYFLLAFILFTSLNLQSQSINSDCDTVVYLMLSQSPGYFGNLDTILAEFYQTLDYHDKVYLREKEGGLEFKLKIDCNGRVTLLTDYGELESFRAQLEAKLADLTWIPGRHNQAPQNVIAIMLIYYDHSASKLRFRTNINELKGSKIRSFITDEKTGEPVSNVRIETVYNGQSYFSDESGIVEYYCDPFDRIIVDHIYYEMFIFELPENARSFSIKLTKTALKLETIDLTKFTPKKLPYKDFDCNFEDYIEPDDPPAIFISRTPYASTIASFNGGNRCLLNYITEKFVLPEKAFNQNYTDTVQISFLVNSNGEISKLNFDKELKYGVQEELNRIFIESPLWEPATQARLKTEQWVQITIIIGSNRFWKRYYG